MTRIKSKNIQLGESFVVPIEQSAHNKKIQEALEKEKEIIAQAEERAQNIIDDAHQQGQKIIEESKAQALSEVDSIKNQAHTEGFEAGRQEGYADITREVTDTIIAVDDFAKSNFDLKRNIIKSASVDIINLVVEIAHKICSNSLELNENILKEITEKAIFALKDKEDITIIVNPLMAEKIYSISDELKEKIPQLSSIKIVEDNSVSPDGTIVESPLSRVDSRVRSQINQIADKLMGKLDSTSIEVEIPQEESLSEKFIKPMLEVEAITPQESTEPTETIETVISVETTAEDETLISDEAIELEEEAQEGLETPDPNEAENTETAENVEEVEEVEDLEMTDLADSIEVFNSAEDINSQEEIQANEEPEITETETDDVQG